jgi:hypothetical protein
MHLKEQDFVDCFITGENSNHHRASPFKGVGQYQLSKSPSDRLRTRIDNLTGLHQIKQKQKRDIPTNEVEFEKSKHELSFQPKLLTKKKSSPRVKLDSKPSAAQLPSPIELPKPSRKKFQA